MSDLMQFSPIHVPNTLSIEPLFTIPMGKIQQPRYYKTNTMTITQRARYLRHTSPSAYVPNLSIYISATFQMPCHKLIKMLTPVHVSQIAP